MEQFDIIDATFHPIRTDDLGLDALIFIGHRGKWQAMWIIDEEDGGDYVGQWVLSAYDFDFPAGWVPECDLEIHSS